MWEKSIQQNVLETSYLMQTAGLVIPEAIAYKLAAQIPAQAAMRATTAATVQTMAAAGAGSTAGGIGAAGAVSGAAILGLAATGAKLGFSFYALEWLQKNWWIVALIIGGVIAYKVIK